ncbi:hypothetical protein Lalb_Chr06g0172821 [Lupinus albus]|uniref:Uncharacterized protein n=1 Tax=Lupinus albus TaxID=3870 RepID=A0A6A4QGP4_LUPAL|nr:hypothetical protein Lalb_Chr06g0172821 [Lupinus albus]
MLDMQQSLLFYITSQIVWLKYGSFLLLSKIHFQLHHKIFLLPTLLTTRPTQQPKHQPNNNNHHYIHLNRHILTHPSHPHPNNHTYLLTLGHQNYNSPLLMASTH